MLHKQCGYNIVQNFKLLIVLLNITRYVINYYLLIYQEVMYFY